MRRLTFVLAVGVLLVCGGESAPGPTKGPTAMKGQLNPGQKLVLPHVFKGGERACVIVEGDHDPVMELVLEVLDSENRVLVRDAPQGKYGDVCAVIWYPPRTAEYRIQVSMASDAQVHNNVRLVLK